MGSEFEVQEKDVDETAYPHDIVFADVSKDDAAEEQGMEMEGDDTGEGQVCIIPPETLTAPDGDKSERKRKDERGVVRRRPKLRERWSSKETFALIACKRKQIELFGDGGPGGRINAKERKWHDIQKRMAELGVQRTAVECTRRWDNLLSWYKRIVDNDRREDVQSFWEMTPRQRRDHGLKFAMERSVFNLIDSMKLERRANLVRTFSSAVNTTATATTPAAVTGALDAVTTPTANDLTITPTVNAGAPSLLSPAVTPALTPPITGALDPSVTPPTNPAVCGLLTPSLSPAINPPTTGSLDPSTTPTINSMVIGTLDRSATPTINPSLIEELAGSITPPITDACTAPAVGPTFSTAARPTPHPRANLTANPQANPTLRSGVTLLDRGDQAEIWDDTRQATDPNTIHSDDTDSQSPVIAANDRCRQINVCGQPRVQMQDVQDVNRNPDKVAAAMLVMGSDNGRQGGNEHTQHDQSEEGHLDASHHMAQHTPPPFVPSRKRKHVREANLEEMMRAIETHTTKMVTSVSISCNRSCETIMRVGQMQCDALREGLEVQRILAMNVAEAGRLISDALMVVAEKLSSR